jgi:outer membrane protein
MRVAKLGTAVTIICLISGVFFSKASFAEDKFGYVDIDKVFNNYRKTIEADEKLEKKQEEVQRKRENLVSETRKLNEEMELLSDTAREARQRQINEKLGQLQEFDRETTNQLLKERDDIARDIIKELEEVINEIGKKGGYTFIFNERFILYSDNVHNLTDEVLNTLNKRSR